MDELVPTPSQKKELLRLKEWASGDALGELSGSSMESTGSLEKARILYYDLLNQKRILRGNPVSVGVDERLELLQDSIVEAVVEKIRTATQMRIFTLAFLLHPKNKKALFERMQEFELDIQVITNSKIAHGTVIGNSYGVNYPVGYYAGMPDLEEMLSQGVKQIFGFTQKKESPLEYSHRKLLVIDTTVFLGSHNETRASTVYQEEMSIQIESPALAEWAKEELVELPMPMGYFLIFQLCRATGKGYWPAFINGFVESLNLFIRFYLMILS